jgi:AcrR family transcriptional regulator
MEMLFAILAADVIEMPQADDPVDRVEQLLLAHGYVYREPLTKWLFRLHVNLAWSGYPHLHEIGRRVFQGIDAFWAGFLGGLVEQGMLAPFDADIVIPLLLGPVERCTIISQLACGEDETDRPQLGDVARHGAESLFKIWGGDAYWARNARGLKRCARAAHANPAAPFAFPAQVNAQTRLDDALARMTPRQSPAQRKARILLAAAVECQERGYNAASMIEVAARANVSTATLYKHFEDKAGLFSSALQKEALNIALQLGGEPTSKDPRAALTHLVSSIAATSADPDWAWMHNIIMASEISGSARVLAHARASRADIEERVAGRLRDEVRSGALSAMDIALSVNFLLGAVERSGVLALILFGRASVDREKLAALSGAAAHLLFDLHSIQKY